MRLYFPVDLTGNLIMIEKLVLGEIWTGDLPIFNPDALTPAPSWQAIVVWLSPDWRATVTRLTRDCHVTVARLTRDCPGTVVHMIQAKKSFYQKNILFGFSHHRLGDSFPI